MSRKCWQAYAFLGVIACIVITMVTLLITSSLRILASVNEPIERQVVWSVIDIVKFGRSTPSPIFIDSMSSPSFTNITIQRFHIHLTLTQHPFYRPALQSDDIKEIENYILAHKISDKTFSIFVKPGMWLNIKLKPNLAYYLFNVFSKLVFSLFVVMLLLISVILIYKTHKITRYISQIASNLGIPQNSSSYFNVISGPSNLMQAMMQRVNDLSNTRIHLIESFSHDIRTPITRMKFRTERMLVSVQEKELIQKNLDDLSEMEHMVSDIVEFSKLGDLELGKVDINSIIETVTQDYHELGKQVHYRSAPKTHILLLGRINIYKRILNNLINNALRFATRVDIYLEQSHDRIFLRIEDNGPGIPESDIEHLFQRHFQAKNQSKSGFGGGVGLGLAIVAELIHQVNGEIILKNMSSGGLQVLMYWKRQFN